MFASLLGIFPKPLNIWHESDRPVIPQNNDAERRTERNIVGMGDTLKEQQLLRKKANATEGSTQTVV